MKGKKTGGKNWVKGQSGNPEGRRPLPKDVKEARALNRIEFERLANKFLYCTKDEITRRLHDPNTPALELLIGSIIVKAVAGGDERRLGFLLDRLIGKVVDKIDVHSDGPSVRHEHIIALVKELNASAEKQDKENA